MASLNERIATGEFGGKCANHQSIGEKRTRFEESEKQSAGFAVHIEFDEAKARKAAEGRASKARRVHGSAYHDTQEA